MLGFASHVEVCGIAGICGICGDMRDMRDGPPPRNHPGRAAVFGGRPPNPRRAENGNGKQPAIQKKNAYF